MRKTEPVQLGILVFAPVFYAQKHVKEGFKSAVVYPKPTR